MIYGKLVLLVAIGILLACQKRENPIPRPVSEESTVRNESPTPGPNNYESIKEEGWEIPTSNSKHISEKKVISTKTVSGKPIKANSITYRFLEPVFSQDFFKPPNKNPERTLRIHTLTELKANNKVFCYLIEGVPYIANTDVSFPVNIQYQHCDLNGDSKFETRYFGKTLRTLMVPDWVTK